MKPNQPYLVITGSGYWGKGETPLEAAKNANVRANGVKGSLYHADPEVIERVDCTGLGGLEWYWREDMMPVLETTPVLRTVLREGMLKATGTLKVTKGKLVVQQEF